MALEYGIPTVSLSATRYVGALLLFFALLGAARFIYSLSASPEGWTGVTYMEVAYDQHRLANPSIQDAGLKRRWGPLFVLLMDAYTRLPLSEAVRRVLLRLGLTAMYVATLLFLSRTISEGSWPWSREEARARQLALIGLGFQSTPAIYAISNGMGEIVSAFCVVGHFCLFLKRRYLLAAFLICFGVYFKLYPVVFLFPYFVFSMLSRAHRRYCAFVAANVLVIAVLSLVASGWRFGFFYPITMTRLVMSDAELVPMLSKEVFGPVSVVFRIVSWFRVHPVDAQTIALARVLAEVFGALLISSTAALALLLRMYESLWNVEVVTREIALTIFQSAIGFLMFAFSLDVSIALLLPILVSLYSPLWLFIEPLGSGQTRGRLTIVTLALFGAGAVLVGNLIPLSMLFKWLPLAWLDRVAGNAPGVLIPQEQYVWYEIPTIGVLLLFLSFSSALLTIRWYHSAVISDSRTVKS